MKLFFLSISVILFITFSVIGLELIYNAFWNNLLNVWYFKLDVMLFITYLIFIYIYNKVK